ncbi:transcription initiation factor TFIID subunit 4 isoform X1 [Oryzias latipes]|uniref:transcription initiation factor TFIID subunit 4 isoform X1 n=1 Tax=Oryzias latipes TaxID=8090 RepID=UPI0005CC102F|nr:transcription initiation factor TFIID subunit 4 isoform X1 [Oryzias latipes]
MAGARDPLEDMLLTEVDEAAVSDLLGDLESRLGDGSAVSFSARKRDAAAAQLSGKGRDQAGSTEPLQGRPNAGSSRAAGTGEPPPSPFSAPIAGGGLRAERTTSPDAPSGPGPVTGSSQPADSFHRAAAPGAVPADEAAQTPPSGLQTLKGSVKLPNSAAVTEPASSGIVTQTSPVPQTTACPPLTTPQRNHIPATSLGHNGVDPKGAPGPAASSSASQVVNHSIPLMQPKVPPPAAAVQPEVSQPPGVKPAVNGLVQPAAATPARTPLPGGPTSIQQQKPALMAGVTRPVAPQLAVRPQQQQATIQLPSGFTIPPGMVLVRTETGQLVLVPQQVLAQAQVKAQQGQTAVAQRQMTPTATSPLRVNAATTVLQVPAPHQTIRLASPVQTRMAQSPSTTTVQGLTVAPGSSVVSVKMPTAQKTQTGMVAGGVTPVEPPVTAGAPPASAPTASRVTVLSQEMQENVKKCKNFLATLIKLASHNSPSPETAKNVKALVQDLLDAKIEPEEFTSRLQADLKSSPQPYLIPFLKKSLPALRQTLFSSQQFLTTAPPVTPAPAPAAPGSIAATAIRPRLPTAATGGAVRLNPPMTNTTALAAARPGAQVLQTRSPVVIGHQLRHPVTLLRGPLCTAGKSPVSLAASANQKKQCDPGGGTFRDDDDINDVASMAGVNLNEENARILATSSEIVGTKIRSCKDEFFLPADVLHRRILDTARKLGVTEVPADVVNVVSHATQFRLRSLLEKVSVVAQHRADAVKDEDLYEQTSDVRAQLRFFEQLERIEKQRKDEQEREMLLKAAKSRARQEDPEQARLKQKAKEMQQQELAQMRQRDANLTALAAIGPRKKRKLDSVGGANTGSEVSSGLGSLGSPSPRQQLRQRITRVNLRDFILCLEQDRSTARSMALYKALLK